MWISFEDIKMLYNFWAISFGSNEKVRDKEGLYNSPIQIPGVETLLYIRSIKYTNKIELMALTSYLRYNLCFL